MPAPIRPGRAAVPAPGCVPALVEQGGDDRQPGDEQQVHRVVEQLPERQRKPVGGEDPEIQGGDADDDGHDHRPAEQRPEEGARRARGPVGQQGDPDPEREQRAGRREHGRALAGDDAERRELGDNEVADLVAGQRPAELGAHRARDVVGAPGAVHQGGDHVEEPGELDHLPVGPPDQ